MPVSSFGVVGGGGEASELLEAMTLSWFVQLKEDVQELCREILETRSLAEQNLAQAALDDTLSQPLSPAHSVLSLCSTTSLGMCVGCGCGCGYWWALFLLVCDVDSLSTPRKFQRTPQHSQVFDTKDSAKVATNTELSGKPVPLILFNARQIVILKSKLTLACIEWVMVFLFSYGLTIE